MAEKITSPSSEDTNIFIADLEEYDTEFKMSDSNEVLNKKIDNMLSLGKEIHSDKLAEYRECKDLFDGKDTNPKPGYRSKTYINLIFPGYRTMAGLLGDSRTEPVVSELPTDSLVDTHERQKRARMLEDFLQVKWQLLKMPQKSTEAAFQALTYADVFFKPFWDIPKDDLGTEMVRSHDLVFDPSATSPETSSFAVQVTPRNRRWVKDNFPDEAKKVKETDVVTDENMYDTGLKQKYIIQIDEAWTPEMVVIRDRTTKTILDKKPNPFYEFKDSNEQLDDWFMEDLDSPDFKERKNHFKGPKIPFVQFPTYKTGEGFYSYNQTLQLKRLQECLNERKRRTDDMLNQVGSKLVYDKTKMTAEQADMITNRPNCKIGVDGRPDDVIKEFRVDAPSAQMINDMQHTQRSFDDVMGQHDITRGVKSKTQTAFEASVLREADQTCVRMLSRNFEIVVEELMNWWVQLIKLYYTEKKYVSFFGDEEARKYIEISSEDIDEGIEVIIKAGSTIPINKEAKREEAFRLASMQQLDPVSLYEELEKPNPKKLAARLFNWMQGIISDTMPGGDSAVMKADEENKKMAQGIKCKVDVYDDHEFESKVHRGFINSDQCPPEAIPLIEEHIDEHDKYYRGEENAVQVGGQQGAVQGQRSMAGQAGMQGQGFGGGGPATTPGVRTQREEGSI